MERITSKDLNRQLIIIDSVRRALGIDPELSYGLEEGSKTYGRTFKLYGMKEGSSGHYSAGVIGSGWGSIGWTKKEAFQTLVTIKESLSAAAAAQGITWEWPDTSAV